MIPEKLKITGTFELRLNKDGEHATLVLRFGVMNDEIREWLKFTYCNDMLWRHHAGNLGAEGGTEYFSTILRSKYIHFLEHIQGNQYCIREDE